MSRAGLKTGFSTGTAATAAAKAALMALLSKSPPAEVRVTLPQGGHLNVPVAEVVILSEKSARATVIKDGGDDPDATHRAAIQALVRLTAGEAGEPGILISGGLGVGRVTRPGLPVAVGEPAINPGPRKMIEKNLNEAWAAEQDQKKPVALSVEISVPQGERLAVKTLNPRLGIVGGISILGTTGLVKPFSHEAYTATIESGLNVARAVGLSEVVLTTGGKSEKRAMEMRPDLAETAFIQIADYFGFALREVKSRGFERVGLVSFFGKAVKQAQGLVYTHAHQAPMDLARLAGWLTEAGAGESLTGQVARANTARHALDILRQAGALDLVARVGDRMIGAGRYFLGPGPELWIRIIDFDGAILYESPPR